MKVLVAADALLLKTNDGKYWSKAIYSYNFFKRYLEVFDNVAVVSRTKYAEYDEVEGFLRVDGDGVEIRELPYMRGGKAYILNYFKFRRMARAAAKGIDCAVIRLPSVSASMVLNFLKKEKKPYVLEIVADPYDAYSSRRIIRNHYYNTLKKACIQANGVSYVTRDYLQKRYPSHIKKYPNDQRYFETYFSTIQLDESYYGAPKSYKDKKSFMIIHTANNIDNDSKGHTVLLKAVKKVVDDGFDVKATIVGDGSMRPMLEQMSRDLGIDEKIVFTGSFSSSEKVRERLIEADILVFPTKAEGLSRTVIESMAVGLPCVSTYAGGMAELLEDDDMTDDPTDYLWFADKIEQFVSNPSVMEEKSKRNIIVAKNYSNAILQRKRNEFYKKLKELVC